MVTAMEATDLNVVGSGIVESTVASMGLDELEGMNADHLAVAFDSVGSDYMGSGISGFSDIDAVDTFMLEASLEGPDSLAGVMDSEGAASLFGSMFN